MPSWRANDGAKGKLWGLVLAAGDGKRLSAYARQVSGKDLPKQYVNFLGRRSMLEHTLQRAERLIPKERILTVVGRHHLAHEEVGRQLAMVPRGNLIIQPENKETAPGILLPLMHLRKRDSEAVVALFPSDHFILPETRFIDHIRLAVGSVERRPDRIVILAVKAPEPETEYGYIIVRPQSAAESPFGARRIDAFVEKPRRALAQELVLRGGLWNTMTMVFKLITMLRMYRTLRPGLYLDFSRIFPCLGTPVETTALDALYRSLKPINFSREVLQSIAERFPEQLAALAVHDVVWSDWGSEERIRRTIRALRLESAAHSALGKLGEVQGPARPDLAAEKHRPPIASPHT